jgi:hypothetical protein
LLHVNEEALEEMAMVDDRLRLILHVLPSGARVERPGGADVRLLGGLNRRERFR